MAWFTTPSDTKAVMFSFTALGLPGSVTIKVLPMVPATGREREARGVCFSEVDNMR